MANSVKLLNHIDVDGEYMKFYTELDSDFKVGERLFIVGGNFDNTIYTDKNSMYYDVFHKYASGYEVIAVDSTALSNSITLKINYTDTKFTSGGVESYIFDPKPVYKTEEELLLNPNQIREAYISKSYFKQGEFNGGKFQDGIFGVYNIKGTPSDKTYQRQKFVDDLKAKLISITENVDSSEDEKIAALTKLDVLNTQDYSVYETPSINNKAIFNNNIMNTPAHWSGGVFIGGVFQWGLVMSKYNNKKVGKIQSLNDKLGIRSLVDKNKYNIKTFTDNNDSIGYSQFVSGNIGTTEHKPHFTTGRVLSAHWINGTFENGTFEGGYWYNGDFKSGSIRSKYQKVIWENGIFGTEKSKPLAEDLIWNDGLWLNGTWRGASTIGIEKIYYGDNTINIEIKSDKKHLFTIGQNVFLSYIKNSLSNKYLDNYTDIPNYKLLNFQSFKLININEISDVAYRTTLVLEGTSDENLNYINLQHAKVSQSLFNKGTWEYGVWESGLRKPAEYKVAGIESDTVSNKTEITLFFNEANNLKVGDKVVVSNLTSKVEDILDGRVFKRQEVLNKEMTIVETEWVSDKFIKVSVDSKYHSITMKTESDAALTTDIIVSTAIWKGGIFRSGVWDGGILLNENNSTFSNYLHFDIQNKQIQSIWKKGYWSGGIWENGVFLSGVWEKGLWKNGIMTNLTDSTIWLNGTWENGTLNRGIWNSGKMLNGTVVNACVKKIDWKSGAYTNAHGLYNSDVNTNKSGRYSLDKSESITAPSIIYMDTQGWVQLDQPSFYQKGYNVIFKDLDLGNDNPYNNEMFTISDTVEYGTRIKVSDNIGDNPLSNQKTLPIVSVGNIIDMSTLSDSETSNVILVADNLHKRLVELDTKTGLVNIYGKVVGGTGNLDITFNDIVGMYANPYRISSIKDFTTYKTFSRTANVYVIDNTEIKIIVINEDIKEEAKTETIIKKDVSVHSIIPPLDIAEQIIDIWVSNDTVNEEVFIATDYGNVYYWSYQHGFNKLNIFNVSEYAVKNFSVAKTPSGTIHIVFNGNKPNGSSFMKHVVLNYSNANEKYNITTVYDITNKVYSTINSVTISLDGNTIKIWLLTPDKIYTINYGKYFSGKDSDNSESEMGNTNNISYISYNTKGYLDLLTTTLVGSNSYSLTVGKTESLSSTINTIIFKGYKVESANRELSPYITARILYNTKLSKDVSFNKGGSIYSAHLVSSTWDNGLFVGSWDVPKYLNHYALEKNTAFIKGEFNGEFNSGYFLGGVVVNNGVNTLKQGHVLSDLSSVEWYGHTSSTVRYDIESAEFLNGKFYVSIQALSNVNGQYKKILASDIVKKSDVQIPSIFKASEIEIISVRNGGLDIDGYDEVVLTVKLPQIYENTEWDLSTLWNHKHIFISTTEHTESLFGYQYVSNSAVKEADGIKYLYLTIRSDFKTTGGVYEFKKKPKILVSKFIKVNDIIHGSLTRLELSISLPTLSETELIKFIKKFYLLDNVDVKSGKLIIPGYSQLFTTSINKTFNQVIVNTPKMIENVFIDNVTDDSYVKINLGNNGSVGKTIATNLTVRNSYITSSNSNDNIESSIFLSGKTDRNWVSGAWLNLDSKGFSNGNSQFGTPTAQPTFEGNYIKILSANIQNKLLFLKVNSSDLNKLPANPEHTYITIRGIKGDNAVLLGASKSKVFKIVSIDTQNSRVIVNPMFDIADSNIELSKQNIFLKNTQDSSNTVGVEAVNELNILDYAYISMSCWNGGDFYGKFNSIWNGGNFRNGTLTPTAKWFGSHEVESWAGTCSVSVSEKGSEYELKMNLNDSVLQVGEFIYVKFNPVYINGELIQLYKNFYSVVTLDDTNMKCAIHKSAKYATKPSYDVQILRYRSNYSSTNTLITGLNSPISKQYKLDTKSYDIPRESFFYNGIFQNETWNSGVFLNGNMIPTTNKTVWVNGIKHNGHFGGSNNVPLSKHIHWLGGFHETENNESKNSVKNIIWYRGIWNGGVWHSGHWHSLTNDERINTYDNKWSIWKKGEFYSKGRNIAATVASTNVANTLKAGDTIDSVVLKTNDIVYVMGSNNGATANLSAGLYKIVDRGYLKEDYAVTKFTVYVSGGTYMNKVYDFSTHTELNVGNLTTNHPDYNESVWHGGTWDCNLIANKKSYESDLSKVYRVRENVNAEYKAVSSIWLGGMWLRGLWLGGIFTNGYWHSVTTIPVTTTSGLTYEEQLGYVYNSTVSEWRTGKMINSIWAGGTVKDMVDVLDTVFGDITNYDGYERCDGFGAYEFKKSDRYTDTILGRRVFNKASITNMNQNTKIHQAVNDGILPVYWNRGVWENGLMQFSYWRNYDNQNKDITTITNSDTLNTSIFKNGCMYSSYWEGGLMNASASANSINTNTKYLNATQPLTVFYKSHWEKGYWQAVGLSVSNLSENSTNITDALFVKSVWDAGVFEGGVFDLSVWRTGTRNSGVKISYSSNAAVTLSVSSGDVNPLYAITNTSEIDSDASKMGLVKAATLFTDLAKMRYVGGVDNFASVWVNGTMRGSTWHGGVWQRGVFRDKEYTDKNELNFFEKPNNNEESVSVWTRGIWLSGYFSYFNDVEIQKANEKNEYFASGNGKRCLFMGIDAKILTEATYKSNSILGVTSLSSEFNNKASVFGRRMHRKDNKRYFSIFNGTFVNGTFLDDMSNTASDKFNKVIISPFAVVGGYGYNFKTKTVGLLNVVPFNTLTLDSAVTKTVKISADISYTIPLNTTNIMHVNGSTIVANSGNLYGSFLYSAYNGHFHTNPSGSASIYNTGVWRHDHISVGDGMIVTANNKSVLQGSALQYHKTDVYGGEPNYSETTIAQPN